MPQVLLKIGDLKVPIQNRSAGGLTGSRVAGALGRIPVESMIAARHQHWKPWGFSLENGIFLTLSVYVDNLFSCSSSMAGAIHILTDAAEYLETVWGHKIKPSSRMVMSCQGSRELPVFDESWQRVSAFPCLGHILQDNGSIRACFSNTTKSMWRAYWGNSRHSALQKAAHNVKFKLLDTSCRPALSYRCSRWPPQPCMARSLDRIQAKMVAAMLRIPRLPGEDGP